MHVFVCMLARMYTCMHVSFVCVCVCVCDGTYGQAHLSSSIDTVSCEGVSKSA